MPEFTRFDGEYMVDIVGERLAEVTTERAHVQRWSEVEVFHDTEADTYIVLTIGRSNKPGEQDYFNFHESPCDDVAGLINLCRLRNGTVPPVTMSALLKAAQKDENLRNELMRVDL